MNKYDELITLLYEVNTSDGSFKIYPKNSALKNIRNKVLTYFNKTDYEDIMMELSCHLMDYIKAFEAKNISSIDYLIKHLEEPKNGIITYFNSFLYRCLYNQIIDIYYQNKKDVKTFNELEEFIENYKEEEIKEYQCMNVEGKWIRDNLDNVLTNKQKEFIKNQGKNEDGNKKYHYQRTLCEIKNRMEKAYAKSLLK